MLAKEALFVKISDVPALAIKVSKDSNTDKPKPVASFSNVPYPDTEAFERQD